MIYTTTELLKHAIENHYTIIAPSIFSADCMRAAIEAAEKSRSPVILNMNMSFWGETITRKYADFLIRTAREFAYRSTIPVAVHLVHGMRYEECIQAISCGMTSVSIDVSKNLLEERIAITKKITHTAHAAGVSVEGCWRGSVDLEILKMFCKETKIDSIGVVMENGKKFEDSIKEIRKAMPEIPVGGYEVSGIESKQLSMAAQMGICKIDVETELEEGAAMAVIDSMKREGRAGGVFGLLREGYKRQIEHYMTLFHSEGMAWSI